MADASGMRVHSNHLNVHKLEFLLGVHAMRRFYLYHVLPVSRLPKAIIIFHNLHLNSLYGSSQDCQKLRVAESI